MFGKDILKFIVKCYFKIPFYKYIDIKNNIILFCIKLNQKYNIEKIIKHKKYDKIMLINSFKDDKFDFIIHNLKNKYNLDKYLTFEGNNIVIDLY